MPYLHVFRVYIHKHFKLAIHIAVEFVIEYGTQAFTFELGTCSGTEIAGINQLEVVGPNFL